MRQQVIVDIAIAPEEYLKLYEGVAENARVTARDGRKILFPAKILRPFLTRQGIRGSFCIYFDKNNKFTGIDRLG